MKQNISKQMDLTDRIVIEVGLLSGRSFQQIAKELHRHPSTIKNEVMRNRMYIPGTYYLGNDCRFANRCSTSKHHLCGDKSCNRRCFYCKKFDCRDICKKYVPRHCEKTDYPPYVCNACYDKRSCVRDRYIYSAKHAQGYQNRRRSESRQGIHLSDVEKQNLDELLTRLIQQGQPLAHIYAEHRDEIPVTLRTLYNYIDSGEFTIRNIDLRRKTTYRQRKRTGKKKVAYQANCRIGRSYEDFQVYTESKDPDSIVEMDTVIGRKGAGNRILTMIFRKNSVMLMFLIPDGKAESVKRVFDYLEFSLGFDVFSRLFPVILTDNGSEFKRVDGLELNEDYLYRTRIFYCDPQAAWQKSRIEKNHEFIRYALPKGKSLNGYTQEDLTLLTNHINSTKRPGLGYKSPYDLVDPDDLDMRLLMKVLKMHPIPPDEVRLNPDIFRKL